MADQQQQDKRLPFRLVAREQFAPITTRAVVGTGASANVGGDLEPIKIPEVGVLGELLLSFSGTGTISAAMVAKARGLWALIKQLRITTNISSELIRASGWGLARFGSLYWPGFVQDGAPIGASAPSSNYYAFAGPGAGAQTWKFMLGIPIQFNIGRQFDKGAFTLAAEGVEMYANITLGNLADICPQLTDLSGTMKLSYRTYEMPDERIARLPARTINRIIEGSKSVAGADEDTRVEIPRSGVLYNLLHYFENNGAFADANVQDVGLDIDKGNVLYKMSLAENQFHNRRLHGVDLPPGHWAWDWAASDGVVNSSLDDRDSLDLRRASVTESTFTIPSGTVLTNAKIFTERRIWQQLN